ncbi:MAG TPA: HNH endonuclease signature motif containing protein [Rhizomicrobium sp.]|nr:HNH endonuclease signature motif containing protein [Rhizomicrobium sp.]
MGWTLQPIDIGPEPRDEPNAFLVPFVPDEKAYNRYRKSAEWQKIRARVISTARGRCRCCGKAANEVHHRDYRPRVLAGADDSALVAVCTDCHRKIHFAEDGQRRPFWQENERVLAALVAQNAVDA